MVIPIDPMEEALDRRYLNNKLCAMYLWSTDGHDTLSMVAAYILRALLVVIHLCYVQKLNYFNWKF